MKTLDEVIDYAQMIVDMIPDDGADRYDAWSGILHYLKQYRADLDKKCMNCKHWRGHDKYDPNYPEEYSCGAAYLTWTYAEDNCSRWEERI